MTSISLNVPSLKGKVSAEEWAARVDLAAAYRLVSLYKWEDLVFTHISLRVPDAEDEFLINPYGVFFDEITASSLVKIDLKGQKIDDSPFEVKPRLVADLGDKTSLILRNHGLLTVGETVADAWVAMYYLEASCAIQVRAQAGGELIPVPKDVLEQAVSRQRQGARVWPGLLRRLERVDPSYNN